MDQSFSHPLFQSLQEKEEKPLSISQLTDLVKNLIEGSFPSVVVEGEISNCKPSSTGHIYFTLKDNSAAISAVMFRGKAKNLDFLPRDGMMVQARGSLSVYAPRGSYQIIIDSMEQAGTGDILKLLEQRKRELAAEGLFDTDKKKPLPFFPTRIGVVTSPTGAALRDILQIVRRRNNSISVVVLPCPVQGNDAPEGIIRQIVVANAFKLADVLIVGRGGGSLEDLLPFSDENVVRAIANSTIPVVSAVGHEIDWAISDYAADVRAPTPSAAAELVTPLKADLYATLKRLQFELEQSIKSKLEKAKLLVKSFSTESMELRFRSIQQPLLMRFDDAKEALLENMQSRITDTKIFISNCITKLEGANPSSILERGYSMVRNKETGEIIRSNKQVKSGDLVEICPANGKITAKIENTD